MKVPELGGDTEKLTEPVGVIGFPLEVSLTVAVHVSDWPIVNEPVEQLTVVLAVL